MTNGSDQDQRAAGRRIPDDQGRPQPKENWGDDDGAEGVEGSRPARPDAKIDDRYLAAVPWRAAKSLLKLRAQVDERAPRRSHESDGTVGDAAHQSRESDHNPWVRDGLMGVVTAMDITNDPGNGCGSEALARSLVRSRDSRIKYVISNRRIANSTPQGGEPAWTWRPYGGHNPHDHHVHVSVLSDRAHYDDEADWTFVLT